jgi:hypothetical protein
MTLTDQLAQAIARFEGFYNPGSRAQRNNNPGNIRIWGSLPRDAAGYAIFPDEASGWAALRRQIDLDTGRGLTLTQFLMKYAPPADNNPTPSYIRTVAGWLGIPTDVPLKEISPPLPRAAGAPRGAGGKPARG